MLWPVVGRPPRHPKGGTKPVPAEKICIICGEDCADRPRLKDSNGQYACQACVEAKKRRRTEPMPSAATVQKDAPVAGDGIGFSMDDYLGDVRPADANPCPKCGMGRPDDAVVCMRCGFNSESGRAISTRVSKEKVKRARSAPRVSRGAVFLVVIAAMFALLPGMAFASKDAAMPMFFLGVLWYLVAYFMMVSAAFYDDDKFWGWLGILFWVPIAGTFCWLAFVLVYCTIGGQRGTWKLNFWAAVFAIIAVATIIGTVHPSLLEDDSPPETLIDSP